MKAFIDGNIDRAALAGARAAATPAALLEHLAPAMRGVGARAADELSAIIGPVPADASASENVQAGVREYLAETLGADATTADYLGFVARESYIARLADLATIRASVRGAAAAQAGQRTKG